LFHALRREELCKLKVKDAQHARKGVPHLRVSGKGGKTRYVPLHPGTQTLIHDYLAVAGHGDDEHGALFRPVKNNTTGQGAAGAKGAANLSTEQRTKIRTVIKEKVHVQPLTNVNFSISIGTRVPRTVHFYPVPAEVISIYPEWRGYKLILVNNQYIIVDPNTYEIVYIIA
jgi:hypothetical protein